ncbi:MAG: LptF/LptG family permease, partial [Geopsychrobacter sp.]|nr:LptF/LptG family permease [Geopsychrobacter sp.]
MPKTLYWYILKELLKLLLLSCIVLVVVISVAASIKPLTEGLLGPIALMKFVAFTAPTMLTFALPFAGAFASTLVFLRMSSDNEITACVASGMSYASILTPVAGLGLTLTMMLFFMGNFIIPSFYRAAAQTVEADLMTVVVSRLNDNQSFRMGEFVLYADSAQFHDPPVFENAAVQPSQYIELRGVAIGQTSDGGRMTSDATAQAANILVYQGEQQSWVTLRMRNAMYFDPSRGELIYHELYDMPPVKLPGLLQDKPRFLSWLQLRQMNQHPERFDRVKQAQQDLIDSLAFEALQQRLGEALSQGQAIALRGPRAGEVYTLSAPSWQATPTGLHLSAQGDTPVRVDYQSSAGIGRRFDAQQAQVQTVKGLSPGQPELAVRLERGKVHQTP